MCKGLPVELGTESINVAELADCCIGEQRDQCGGYN